MIDFDNLVKTYNKKGIATPTKEMIKTKEQIEGIKKAGIINTMVLDYVSENIHVGMTTEDINTLVHTKTLELGGTPAPLNYQGFPKSVCTSINDQVCHGIPSSDVILKDGDIINVDCTTIVDGYYADASRMFLIGNVSEKHKKLVNVTKECLDLAVASLKPFGRLGDIGYAIETHAKKNGYSVVRNIGGHGVGIEFHEDPFIYHFGKKNTGMVLFPGMIFTIEPMINEGTSKVFLDAQNEWTIYTWDGGYSAQYEYTVLITEDGVEILTH